MCYKLLKRKQGDIDAETMLSDAIMSAVSMCVCATY